MQNPNIQPGVFLVKMRGHVWIIMPNLVCTTLNNNIL